MKAATLLVSVLGAALVAAPLAYATDLTATLTAIDTGKHEIGLDNGKVYSVVPQVQLNNFKPGDKVTMSYGDPTPGFAAAGFAGVATAITPAK